MSVRGELARRLVAEGVGTALLLVAIVGSGIVTATDGPASLQLFQHAIAVGAALTALILAFGPVSGAHFNPAVTLADAWFGGLPWRYVPGYLAAQLLGAAIGTVVTTASFGLGFLTLGTLPRATPGAIVGEGIATAGLLLVIFGTVRSGGGRAVAGAVGAFIAAAIFSTSSAAFANPAVTFGRALTDTYTAIAPGSVPGFLLGQGVGLLVAVALAGWLFAPTPQEAAEVVVPHAPGVGRSADASTGGGRR